MPVEQARYISELDASRPQGTESLSEADDNLRLIKNSIQQTLVGNASDPFDTPLRVGPRALNALSDTLNLSSFVTLSGIQTITATKTFTQGIVALSGILGSVGTNLIARFNGMTAIGNVSDPILMQAPDKNSFFCNYGATGENLTAILHTGNIAETVVNIIYPIGSVLFDATANNPSARFPGTQWERIGQGRYIVAQGQSTDLNGETRNMTPGELNSTFKTTLSEEQIPPHRHGLGANTDIAAKITWDAGENVQWRFVKSGFEYDAGETRDSTGTSAPIEKALPGYVLYTWKRIA